MEKCDKNRHLAKKSHIFLYFPNRFFVFCIKSRTKITIFTKTSNFGKRIIEKTTAKRKTKMIKHICKEKKRCVPRFTRKIRAKRQIVKECTIEA